MSRDSGYDETLSFFGSINNKQFNDPFMLPSSAFIPKDFKTALDFCLFLYMLNPQYRKASQRVVSHFITDVNFTGEKRGDKKEQDFLDELLKDKLDIMGHMAELGEEHAVYGNAFSWVYFPFDRFLVDRRGGTYKEYAVNIFKDDVVYNHVTMKYTVTDPKTLQKGKTPVKVELPFVDRKSQDTSRIKLIKLDPRYVILDYAQIGDKARVIFRFPPDLLHKVKNNFIHQVNHLPIPMLKAISLDEDFIFNDEVVYHLKAPTISGISNNGWGLPETIANYRSLHNLQVYRKIDEQVGLDYMLPFRLFSPNVGENVGAATTSLLMSQWGGHMKEIISRRRKDPTAMHALPFPVNYQEVGAEGKSLTPQPLIEYQTNNMLDGMGFPAELFKGSLQVQQIPTAMRLFENSFHYLSKHFNNYLRWVTKQVLDYLSVEQIGVTLKAPALADDLENRSIYLQLAQGGEIPRSVAYAPWGIKDPIEAAKERAQEDLDIDKEKNKLQSDYQRQQQAGSMDAIIQQQTGMAQQGGGQPQGGAAPSQGMAGPSDANTTPLDIMNQAEDQAGKLLQMPTGDRIKALRQLQASNPNLHAATKQKMEEMRAQGASQGRAQVGQQAQQQAQQQGGS